MSRGGGAVSAALRARRLLVAIGSLVAVVFSCDDRRVVVALALFMALAGALTMARCIVPERARRTYVLASVAVLTLAVVLLRKGPALLLFADPGRRWQAPAALISANFSVLGISYCYLRATYGLFERSRLGRVVAPRLLPLRSHVLLRARDEPRRVLRARARRGARRSTAGSRVSPRGS